MMRHSPKPRRSVMPVVSEALAKVLNQLAIAKTAAAISGNSDMAAKIAAAAETLTAVRDEANAHRRQALH